MNKTKFSVITYHRIDDSNNASSEKHSVHIDEFYRHISYINEKRYETIDLSDLRNERTNKTNCKRIAITFDDGHISDYEIAYPILKKFNLVGTFFITTDWVEKPGYVTWEQLRDMSKDGMSIQSHGASHRFLSDLSKEDLIYELKKSKEIIEEKINKKVSEISIPGGFDSRKVNTMAIKCGYRNIYNSKPGYNSVNINAQENRVVNRYMVTKYTTNEELKKMIESEKRYSFERKYKYLIKEKIRFIIGNEMYYRFWKKYINN